MYKLIKFILVIFLLLFITIQSQAQAPDTAWTRTYGGGNWDQGSSVQQTFDGGYIITGYTYSYGTGGDVYLIKTNSTGDTAWTRTYGGGIFDYGHSVQQTIDSGYIIGGYTNSFGAGGFDLYLIKTDSVGDTAWTRTFGRGDYDHGYSALQTSDGGYIITGDIDVGADNDVYIVKVDSMGDSLWAKTYGGSSDDVGFSIRQTADGGYIIGAYTESYGAGNYDVYLIKTDSMGDSLWARTYGGSGDDYLEEIQTTNDGGFIIAGYTESFGAVNFDAYIIRTDSMGDSLWAKKYGEDYYDYASSVWQTTDGGYIFAGGTGSFGVGSPQVYIFKTDSLGDTLWNKFVGGDGEDHSSSVQQTSDGGYIIVGTMETGVADGNIYLIKLAPTPEINITSPNGGEEWEAGSTHDITWTSTNTSGTVNIIYSVNNGLDWTGIVSGTPDDGIHPWTVPDTVSDSCLISISDTNGSVSDTSDSVFTISSLPPQIISVNPIQNALNISKSTNISVTFDQDMNSSTINDSTFVVHSLRTGLHTGIYNYDSVTNTAEFDPDNDFVVGEIVSVFLTTDIEDVTDDTLTNPYAWSFTIEVDGGTGTFAEKVDYGAGDSPHSFCSPDLDGDGDMDLAVANYSSSTVSVLLNNGNGTFAGKVDYSTGTGPWSVFSSDLDGDGDMDLAVANEYAESVSILLNNGDGTFAEKVDYGAGRSPYSVFSSDLDGDGYMDLAVANYSSGNISVFLNNGDGTFAEKVDYGTGRSVHSVVSSDLDSDGDMDLVVANRAYERVSVLLNNGDGSFAGRVDYDAGDSPVSVFSSDLDSDGDMDLAVANGSHNRVSVLSNNGDGTFVLTEDYGTGSYAISVFSSDLDSDDDMDLAVANHASNNISVFFNNGDGTFTEKVDYAAGDGPTTVFSSDLDGDGDMDLAAANDGSDNVSVLLNNGPFISIVSPNGGEEWVVDSTYNITWNSAGTSGNVHIEFYSADSGFDYWADVIDSTPDDGSYPWTIPNAPSDSCLVRISDIDGSPSDTCDAKFTIVLSSGISDELPDEYSFDLRGIALNNRLKVRYALPEKVSNLKFTIYDIAGQKITEEQINDSPAGFYSVEIIMSGVSKGVYFLRMEADGNKFIKTNKFVLM